MDLLRIYDYISAQAPGYADVVCDRILARPQQLIEHPHSGSIVPEFDQEDVREVFVHSFRIIHRVSVNPNVRPSCRDQSNDTQDRT